MLRVISQKLPLQQQRWIRALDIAKILFDDNGYHTAYLEEIKQFIMTQQNQPKEINNG